MEKITKKQIKQIQHGNHAVLMECLEFLLDSYEEDKYELGYGSCVADLSVHAKKLIDAIWKLSSERSPDKPFNRPNLAKVIEDYFNTIIKKNE
jgi:hypothetical protein